jgi:polyisoprenoid-binding protein YceI
MAAASSAQDVVAPAGAYTLDKDHASITWKVSHFGTSTYVARFNEFDAALTFDPANPAASTLDVMIDVSSLDLDFRNVANPDNPDAFYNELLGIPEDTPGRVFFQVPLYPTITFKATGIEVTGENTGRVTGDLTLHGQTHPATLDVTYNGAREGFGTPPVIGFSATTTILRSQWGMDTVVPLVSDEVRIEIEAEFFAPAA